MRSVQDDVTAIGRMAMVPTILDAMVRTTGMRFAAVARVTDTTWTACAVRDDIAFGLQPGSELVLDTTICNEIRQHGQAVIFASASAHPHFRSHPTPKMYGLESYASIPIVRADGSFFGTLCAIDPRPASTLDDPGVRQTLELFAQLVAAHLDAQDLHEQRQAALRRADDVAQQLELENLRISALLAERDQAELAITRELKDTRRLRDVAAGLIGTDGGTALYGDILDAALEIAGADAGTIQRLDPATQTLGFLATRGFEPDILGHFARVDAASGSPCGVALARGQRATVTFGAPGVPDDDGAHRWHLDAGVRFAQSTPLISRSGQPLGMFSTHWREPRDLSERELRFLDLLGRQAADLIERHQVQAALLASEQRLREEARRKDEFIAVLAHELRNPLAPIRSSVELLAHATHQPHLVEQVRPVMERQLRHMTRLVDDLLDVSRISSGKVRLQPQPVNLHSLVDTAVEAHRGAIAAAGLTLDVRLDDPDLTLTVDATRLSQVISNVLHNAAKFTPEGGRITLRATRERGPVGAPDEMVLRIADTGIGIPAELLPTVFELFTQARSEDAAQGGMGIGLALGRRLMELHGGTLTATSFGPGHGSEFTLRVPLPTAEAQAAAMDAAPAQAPPTDTQTADIATMAGLRVLIVDDNQDAADALAMLMDEFGGEVHVVYDARRIVETVREFNPSLVLLDIGLPSVDGYEACRLIRQEKGSAVRIAALTGWGQDEDRRRTEEAGFDLHLTKPVEFERLAALARQVH